MTLKTYLAAEKRKTFTKADFEAVLGNPPVAELYAEVQECVESGLLSPVKISKTNGNRTYPVFLKYRKCAAVEDYSAEEAAIKNLHPLLLRTGVLQKNPAAYRSYAKWLAALSNSLFAHPEKQIPISRKERSFAIFGEEKALEEKGLCNLLRRLGLGPAELAFYDTPEYCFADYVPVKKATLHLLICENKDIWFNLRRMMFEQGTHQLFGTDLDGVLYGQGNRVTEDGALAAYTEFLRVDKVRYLYWGDLDRAGIDIYQRLKKGNPTLELELFGGAYQAMLHLAEGVALPQSDDHRERIPEADSLFDGFTQAEKERANEILRQNLRLPQEIVNYAVLMDQDKTR